MRLVTIVCLLMLPFFLRAQHPVAFITKAEAASVKKKVERLPLLQASFGDIKKEVDNWLGKEVDVPFPKDPAGGYTHDRHKANYMLMFNSGLLYNLTGDVRYATLVKNILLKYAVLNPGLVKHPQAKSSSPGHLFHQALNDANWLVYTGLAYDLVYNTFSLAERKKIEEGAFKPEVDFITKDLQIWFDLIHNHGVWACAGVGIVGIATGNEEYVQKALYGTTKEGKGGFIAQLNNLFSPDGYYTEGPYYIRYALLPFYLFANALHNARPDLKIFEHRDQILRKALVAALQQTNLDGTFYTFNDGMKDKDFTTTEMVMAINIAWAVYGKDNGLLAIAQKQNKVVLNGGGVDIATALEAGRGKNSSFPYQSVEYRDGTNGNEGGISLLRMDRDENLTSLLFKYSAHGLSHGHYDKLGFFLYDKGNEIFQDYGSVRFVNVEQKYGGRYLPENDAFASQTIAHNTLVADETSHFNGVEREAEKYHPEKLFSSIDQANIQVVSARDQHAYPDIQMHRTLYLLQLPDSSGNRKKYVVDIFNARSGRPHQYDLPFQYKGQVIKTSFPYKAATAIQEPLGKKNGYQFYWKEAEANAKGPLAQFTFLNDKTFYTVSSLVEDSTKLFFVRAGANDPDFNLRRDPAYIIRKKGAAQVFVNVIEIHGKYDPVNEFAHQSNPAVGEIRLLQNDDQYTVALIRIGTKELVVAQSNTNSDEKTKHELHHQGLSLEWTGPYTVIYQKQMLK